MHEAQLLIREYVPPAQAPQLDREAVVVERAVQLAMGRMMAELDRREVERAEQLPPELSKVGAQISLLWQDAPMAAAAARRRVAAMHAAGMTEGEIELAMRRSGVVVE